MKIFLFCLLLLPTIYFAQEETPKSVKSGWAIHAGAGNLYGGNIGILVENQLRSGENMRFSPLVAFGIAEGESDSLSNDNLWLGYTLGINLEYGKMHRVIFGPQLVGNILSGKSVEIKKKSIVSASLILGYKGTAKFGLIWQVYIGDLYTPDPFTESNKYAHTSHVGLGLGYKF